MSKIKKTPVESISAVINRGPKKGLTAGTIAERAGISLSSTRTALGVLIFEGKAAVVGTLKPATGRPANLYAKAA